MMLRVLLLGDGLIFRKIVSLELCMFILRCPWNIPIEILGRAENSYCGLGEITMS